MVWVSRSNHSSPEHTTFVLHGTRRRWVYCTGSTRSSSGVQFALTCEQAVATTLLLFQGFLLIIWEWTFLLHSGTVLKSVQKTSLVLSQTFQRVAILSPHWQETFQCPSLTSSVVIPAVDSLAEYEPWWSCKVAFSGLCHPWKRYICHNHHCL